MAIGGAASALLLMAAGAEAAPSARCDGPPSSSLGAEPADLLAGALKGADGRTATLRPAKAYVLYYGAQWCGPCRLQVRAMKAAYQSGDARQLGYEIVFVSGDRSPETALAYVKAEKMPWPYLPPGVRGPAKTVADQAGRSLPDMVVTDARGRVLCRAYTPEGRYLGVSQTFQALRRTLGARD